MNRILSSFLLVTCAFVSLAFQWPWEVQQQAVAKKKNAIAQEPINESPRVSFNAKAKAQEVVTDIQSDVEAESEENQVAVTPENLLLGSMEAAPNLENMKFEKVPQAQDQSIAKISQIQKQLDSVIKVNESLKVLYKNQTADIEQIRDQSQAHRKMLADLPTNQTRFVGYSAKDLSASPQQDELNSIREQAQRNNEIAKGLKRGESLTR